MVAAPYRFTLFRDLLSASKSCSAAAARHHQAILFLEATQVAPRPQVVWSSGILGAKVLAGAGGTSVLMAGHWPLHARWA